MVIQPPPLAQYWQTTVLVNSHWETIPCLRAFTTRCFAFFFFPLIILRLGRHAHWPYHSQIVFLCILNSVNCHIGYLSSMFESSLTKVGANFRESGWEPMAESSAVNIEHVSPLSTKVPKVKVGCPLAEYLCLSRYTNSAKWIKGLKGKRQTTTCKGKMESTLN